MQKFSEWILGFSGDGYREYGVYGLRQCPGTADCGYDGCHSTSNDKEGGSGKEEKEEEVVGKEGKEEEEEEKNKKNVLS